MPQTPPQTLDTKLAQTKSLDSIDSIASPLLFTRPDATHGFVHDTYKDFFLAKYFAEEINSGRMSVGGAYVNYWSYEEDKKLWRLEKFADEECMALLPAWRHSILFLAFLLNNSHVKELVNVLSRNYFVTLNHFESDEYNNLRAQYGEKALRCFYSPFTNDLAMCWGIIRHKDLTLKGIYKKISDEIKKDIYCSVGDEERLDIFQCVYVKEQLDSKVKHLLGWFDDDLKLHEKLKGDGETYSEEKLYNLFLKGLDDPLLIYKAIEGLVIIGRKDSAPRFIRLLTESENVKTKRKILQALGKIGGQGSIEAIASQLKEKRNSVRYEAARVLVKTENPVALPYILPLLHHPDSNIQDEVFRYLKKFHSVEVVDEFIKRLDYKPDGVTSSFDNLIINNVTIGIVQCLGKINSERTIKALENRLKTAEGNLKDSILGVLGKKGIINVTDYFIGLLEKGQNILNVLDILSEIGDLRAVDTIIEYVQKVHGSYKIAALNALANLGGKKALRFLINSRDLDYITPFAITNTEGIKKTLRQEGETKIWRYINDCVLNTPKGRLEYTSPFSLEYRLKNDWLLNICLEVLGEIGTNKTIKKLSELYYFIIYHHNISYSNVYNSLALIHSKYIPQGYNPTVKILSV